MLVLTRQRDQTVIIGDDIEVTVVDVRGDKVRLGINAPKTISVHRKEVYEQIRRENQEAAMVQPGAMAGAARMAGPMPATISGGAMLRPSPAAVIPSSAGVAADFPRLAVEVTDPFLRAAMEEALTGLHEGGLPIGAVLVRAGQIIGRGRNRREQSNQPALHAEIDCINNAGKQATYRDTALYTTLTPCYLCSGAAIQFGIPRIFVGDTVTVPGDIEFLRAKGIELTDLHDARCMEMMTRFLRDHPERWHTTPGK